MDRYRNALRGSVALGVALLVAAPASAASLQQLAQSEWQGGVSGLPVYVNMFMYVPDQRATKPPVVVAPHHCQGTGPGNAVATYFGLGDAAGADLDAAACPGPVPSSACRLPSRIHALGARGALLSVAAVGLFGRRRWRASQLRY